MDVQEVNQYYITYFVGRGAPGGSVRSSLPGFQDSTHDEITRTTLSHTISETLSSSGATSVSNLKSNANIVYGAVGSISNYNPVINNIVYGDVPKNSVRSHYDLTPACGLTGFSGHHTGEDRQ